MSAAEDDATECHCPNGNRSSAHLAWHRLVIEQGGPAGMVNARTLQEARGMKTAAPDMHKIQARNERQGKSSPGWRRKAAHGEAA